jgi:alpha-1,2-rhamnosyltransferase
MVVKRLADTLPRLANNGGIECWPVIFREGSFWTTCEQDRLRPLCTVDQSRQQFLKAIPSVYWRASSWLQDGSSRDRSKMQGATAQGSKLGVLQAPFSAYWKWNRFKVRRFYFSQPVHVGARDILILPDGYWCLMEIWDAVARARDSGATMVSIVYDLICLTHPEFFPARTRATFEAYLGKVFEHSHLIATISQNVKRQLDGLPEYANQIARRSPAVTHFRLGADTHRETDNARRELCRIFGESESPYLVVATFEPRKNHDFILDAFEQIWQTNPSAKLVLAGRVGWQCAKLIERARNHPRLNRELFLFHDLSDAEIGYCYARAKAVICASETEGFGLPIVEGQWHDRHVFASDIPVHREVGRDACTYFGLEDSTLLADALINWEHLPASTHTSRRVLPRPETWEEVITGLLQKIIDFSLNAHTTFQPLTIAASKAA